MRTVIDELGGVWESVNITEVRDHTFFAELVLTTSDGQALHISARPSDACALAIRANVPIFAADDVLADAGRTDDDDTSEEGTAEIIDEFQSFLENVNPEDFAP
jgi:bifunctional DNase/RNase